MILSKLSGDLLQFLLGNLILLLLKCKIRMLIQSMWLPQHRLQMIPLVLLVRLRLRRQLEILGRLALLAQLEILTQSEHLELRFLSWRNSNMLGRSLKNSGTRSILEHWTMMLRIQRTIKPS